MNKKEVPVSVYIQEQKKQLETTLLNKLLTEAPNADELADQILTDIKTVLQKDATKVLLKLIGFDNTWGEWKIDHCNGRAGNSPIGITLNKGFKDLVDEFIIENKETLFTLSQKEYDQISLSLHTEFINHLKREAKTYSKKLADTYARDLGEEILNGIKEESVLLSSLTILSAVNGDIKEV